VDYADSEIHTNTVEGFYSIFKRGMKGCISTADSSTCTAMRLNLTFATIFVKQTA
jgi:hypothetical protein